MNPVRTGYSAIADEWVGLRPGTDGLFILSIVHLLLGAERVDLDFLAATRMPAGSWCARRAERGWPVRAGRGGRLLFGDWGERGGGGGGRAGAAPRLAGEVRLADGRVAVPAFQLLAERYLDPAQAPEAVAERCGITAARIREIAAEIAEAAAEPVVLAQAWTDTAGVRHAEMRGRGVAMHAMRGISAHSNAFQTCRALHLLQMLIGAVDTPGSWRYRPPSLADAAACAAGRQGGAGRDAACRDAARDAGRAGGSLVDAEGAPLRIDHAFSWEAPLGLHGLMHMVIANAHAADPYGIDTLFLYMSNMAWNSSPEPEETMRMLADKDETTGEYRIPHVIYADAYFSETVVYADLGLPDTTYLERFDCISLLDRPIGSAEGPADAIRQPVLRRTATCGRSRTC